MVEEEAQAADLVEAELADSVVVAEAILAGVEDVAILVAVVATVLVAAEAVHSAAAIRAVAVWLNHPGIAVAHLPGFAEGEAVISADADVDLAVAVRFAVAEAAVLVTAVHLAIAVRSEIAVIFS